MRARALAFLAIMIGGVCGGLIAYSITHLQCGSDDRRAASVLPGAPSEPGVSPPVPPDRTDEGCTTIAGLGGLLGAIVSAAGVAVIAVLVLRAMAEWRKSLDDEPTSGLSGDHRPNGPRSRSSRRGRG